jgi:hypothetical protein
MKRSIWPCTIRNGENLSFGQNRLIMKTVPLYHVFKSSRPNIKTDEDKQLERDELIKCMFDADKDREKDLDRLNELFKIYFRTWWE